jgi:hypothetical protein
MYASARRFFARLASEIFLSSLHTEFFSNLLVRLIELTSQATLFTLDFGFRDLPSKRAASYPSFGTALTSATLLIVGWEKVSDVLICSALVPSDFNTVKKAP